MTSGNRAGKNIKRTTVRKKKSNRRVAAKRSDKLRSLRNFFVTLVILTIASFGVWQFFDGTPVDAPAAVKSVKPKDVDAGGAEVDPTVLNESSLLNNEEHKEDMTVDKPDEDKLAEAQAEAATIDNAGETLPVDTDKAAREEFERKFPLFAVAYHFHTQILEKPEPGARVLAYSRRGVTFRVSSRVSKKGCSKGWHEVAGGGFICDGKGVNVAKEPITFEPSPPAPKLNEAMPYTYKYAKRNGVAEYWKIPSADEVAESEAVFERIDNRGKSNLDSAQSGDTECKNDFKYDEDELKKVMNNATAKAEQAENIIEDTDTSKSDIAVKTTTPAATPDSVATPVPEQVQENKESSVSDTDVTADSDTVPEVDPYELPPYVHLKMAKGYYVSVSGSKKSDDGTKYVKTVRGRYINASDMYPASPSTFEGVLLDDKNTLPMVFVVNGGSKVLNQAEENGPLKNGDRLVRYSHFSNLGTMKRGRRTYVKIGDKKYVNSRVVAQVSLAEPPGDLQENERWIDINLSQQTLVAYEGAVPVFATLISSGKKDHETPEGEFRIYNKHVAITMDDPEGGEDAYSIEDVPWTQYFKEGYALHAAFWHDRFGKVKSHGCVNLSPSDARRLFFWTGPNVYEAYHGVISTVDNPGTLVVVHQ